MTYSLQKRKHLYTTLVVWEAAMHVHMLYAVAMTAENMCSEDSCWDITYGSIDSILTKAVFQIVKWLSSKLFHKCHNASCFPKNFSNLNLSEIEYTSSESKLDVGFHIKISSREQSLSSDRFTSRESL